MVLIFTHVIPIIKQKIQLNDMITLKLSRMNLILTFNFFYCHFRFNSSSQRTIFSMIIVFIDKYIQCRKRLLFFFFFFFLRTFFFFFFFSHTEIDEDEQIKTAVCVFPTQSSQFTREITRDTFTFYYSFNKEKKKKTRKDISI